MNSAHAHNPERPNERTPLLGNAGRSEQDGSAISNSAVCLPHIGTFVGELRVEDLHKYRIDDLYPDNLQTRSTQTAFALCALLYFRIYLRGPSSRGRDFSVQWRQESRNAIAVGDAEALSLRVWEQFLEEDITPEEVLDVLWSSYPLYPDSGRTVRVIDYLAGGDAPQELLRHPLIHLCLRDTWNYGRSDSEGNANTWSRITNFVDSTGTPHVLHLIDLWMYIAYLGFLFSYLVDPPIGAAATTNLRANIITLYAISRLRRPFSTSAVPFALTVLSFVISFPSTPLPDTFASFLLLLSFLCKIVLLHLPAHPGPLFLLPPMQVLPLAVIVWRGIARAFVPVVTFFLPGLFISWILLALSLNNRWLWILDFNALSQLRSPMESSGTFLLLFAILFLFLCLSLGFSMLAHPFIYPKDGPPPSPWDRYSRFVGLEARQAYVRVVAAYATPYYFPAPFNLFPMLLTQLPQSLFVLSGWKTGSGYLAGLERILWRIVVAPFTFVLSGLWLWNLRTRG